MPDGTDIIMNIFLYSIKLNNIPADNEPIAIPKSKPNKNVAIATPLIVIAVLLMEDVCKAFIPDPVPMPARIPDIANI